MYDGQSSTPKEADPSYSFGRLKIAQCAVFNEEGKKKNCFHLPYFKAVASIYELA